LRSQVSPRRLQVETLGGKTFYSHSEIWVTRDGSEPGSDRFSMRTPVVHGSKLRFISYLSRFSYSGLSIQETDKTS
jgi:hypothetical protein